MKSLKARKEDRARRAEEAAKAKEPEATKVETPVWGGEEKEPKPVEPKDKK